MAVIYAVTANGYFLDEGAKNKSGKKSNYKFSAKIFCEKTKRKSAQRVVWLKKTTSYFPVFFQKEGLKSEQIGWKSVQDMYDLFIFYALSFIIYA
ncbi:hypothetical protein A4244_09250 [Bacillus badius]|nr:hypothetical protein A4244_09250 [Bacillus badius]OCS83188.1 hypothetical protein A6M11_09260 [Bacillus badius]OVE51564.1 hypothetical protein B1A98_10985 [Bacillus badius]